MLLTMEKLYDREFNFGDTVHLAKFIVATKEGNRHRYYAFTGTSSPFAVLADSTINTLPKTNPMTEEMAISLPDWIDVMVMETSKLNDTKVEVRLNPLYAHMLRN